MSQQNRFDRKPKSKSFQSSHSSHSSHSAHSSPMRFRIMGQSRAPRHEPRKDSNRLTMWSVDGTVTSQFAIGDWVRYGTNLIGIVSGITYQDEEPMITSLYSAWSGEWYEAGFRYRLRPNDDFDSWDEVAEAAIAAVVSDEESERLDRLWMQRLRAIHLNQIVAEFVQQNRGVLPYPGLFQPTRAGYWHEQI